MAFDYMFVHSSGSGISRTDPTDSDDQQDVTMMDAESGKAWGVPDELDSQITLDDSSDDELVQDVLDEMKETI